MKQDLWFGAKDTISKKYDHTFKDIFQEVYDAEYKAKFEAAGITYFYSLIDDIVHFLEDILEGVVVLLGDGILCAEPQLSLIHI